MAFENKFKITLKHLNCSKFLKYMGLVERSHTHTHKHTHTHTRARTHTNTHAHARTSCPDLF